MDICPVPSCRSDGIGIRFNWRGGWASATVTKQRHSITMTYKVRMNGPRSRQHSNKTRFADRIRYAAPMSFRLFELTKTGKSISDFLGQLKTRPCQVAEL